ncbi:MAG TPA: hypothetical protein VJP86_00675 [Vicinamibacterales bacterium]|nr:hypothetical protein [Vicinamibacterales bacterium]
MTAYLVPAGTTRFELYAEPPDEPSQAPPPRAGALQRWTHALYVRWHALVDEARREHSHGRLAKLRDRMVCKLAENIAEQRTLWNLRIETSATLLYPSTIAEDEARRILNAVLADARRHHGRWLVIDGLLTVGATVLALAPGPNLIAYYFLFRLVGHLQSWRGAIAGLDRVTWQFTPDASLAELASLVNVPREARAERVHNIAARLRLRRLSVFFDRVAVPSA